MLWKGAGAVKRPGLENLGGRKAHASSNLALSAIFQVRLYEKKDLTHWG